MKREYELTPEQHARILEASKPVMYLIANGRAPASPQENANRAWAIVAVEVGCDVWTIEPSPRGPTFFLAEPKEAPSRAKEER